MKDGPDPLDVPLLVTPFIDYWVLGRLLGIEARRSSSRGTVYPPLGHRFRAFYFGL